MNDFQSTGSGQGMLKTDYEGADALSEALKRKRAKLMETKLGDSSDNQGGFQ